MQGLNFFPRIIGSVLISSFSISFKSKKAELINNLIVKKVKIVKSGFWRERDIDAPHEVPTTIFFTP